MIEVFKTDIRNKQHAVLIVDTVQRSFPQYRANVDIEDCDKVLRIQSLSIVDAEAVIDLLKTVHCNASVLEDKVVY